MCNCGINGIEYGGGIELFHAREIVKSLKSPVMTIRCFIWASQWSQWKHLCWCHRRERNESKSSNARKQENTKTANEGQTEKKKQKPKHWANETVTRWQKASPLSTINNSCNLGEIKPPSEKAWSGWMGVKNKIKWEHSTICRTWKKLALDSRAHWLQKAEAFYVNSRCKKAEGAVPPEGWLQMLHYRHRQLGRFHGKA